MLELWDSTSDQGSNIKVQIPIYCYLMAFGDNVIFYVIRCEYDCIGFPDSWKYHRNNT